MLEITDRRFLALLVVGDLFTLMAVTIIGFVSHNSLTSAGYRVLFTFIPLMLGWLAVAPFLGAYKIEYLRDPAQIWRPVWAMLVAAPLAGWLRGMGLHAPVQPVFVLVIAGVATFAIFIWRIVFYLLAIRRFAS